VRQLRDKVAVVTGAGGGIGRATALRFAEQGCALAVADVRADGLAETRALAEEYGVDVSAHVVDVSVREQVEALRTDVLRTHGACHVLVNNAGVTMGGRFVEDSLDDVRWLLGVNVWGVLHGCHAFLPSMLAQGEGHVVNLSSMNGLVGLPLTAAYSLSKGAVRSFSEALRRELRGTGVGVTSVHPGTFRTGITATARGARGARMAELGGSAVARRFLRSPDVVGRAVVDAVLRDRRRVVVGADARLLDVLARVAPGRSGPVGLMTKNIGRGRPA
jgi:NAD(P)-dependent dehydrogenase (short-subunit alcohol dehydrogenase family)